MKFQSLFELYVNQLQDLYDAEHQIAKALPRMVESATSQELRTAFQEHLDQTQLHINRLEEVFEMHDARQKGETCDGMNGILKEGKDLLKHDESKIVLDAALIAAAQRVEHYEIAV